MPRKAGKCSLAMDSGRRGNGVVGTEYWHCHRLVRLAAPKGRTWKGSWTMAVTQWGCPAMSFTEAPLWSSMKMRQFSHLHHFHLPACYLTLTASYEHCLLTPIPSLGIWGPAMAQRGCVPFCPFPGARHLCRGGQLTAGFGQDLTGEMKRCQLLLVFQPPFRSGRGEKAAHVGDWKTSRDKSFLTGPASRPRIHTASKTNTFRLSICFRPCRICNSVALTLKINRLQ